MNGRDARPGRARTAPEKSPPVPEIVSDLADPGATGPGATGPGLEEPAQGTVGRKGQPEPLPDPIRARVVSVAADTLGALPAEEVPASLRPFARFTPARRAKLAATPIAAALATDAVFRQQVADRLRQDSPDLTAALEEGVASGAVNPLEVGAAAYLLRPPGWVATVIEAAGELNRAAEHAATVRASDAVPRLEEELAAVRAGARADLDRLRGELAATRREADNLRRQLRTAREVERRAQAAMRQVKTTAEEHHAAAAAAESRAEAELRRMRSRLAEAEAAVEAARRAAREGRNLGDVRVRLLLDTVLEAAQGLRRELALPPSSTRPADAVPANRPREPSPTDLAARGHATGDDPALLDQLLALPQVHLLVDGYNVTKTGYSNLPLSEQRIRLVGGLAVVAAQTGAEITCVFDGAELQTPVVLATPRGVRVLFSRAGQTADELIRTLARAEPPGRPVVVVSSDREVADGVRAAGARPVSALLLVRRLARG